MQNRISYYILSLLHLNGSVRIPGVGKIVQSRRPAVVNAPNDMVAAPQSDSTFVPDPSYTGGLLERYIAFKTNLSRTRVRKELVHFSQHISETTRQDDTVHLDCLGTFSNGQGGLEFQRHEEFLNPGYAAFSDIALPPDLRPSETQQVAVEKPYELFLPPLVPAWPEQGLGEHHREDHEVPSETVPPLQEVEADPVREEPLPALPVIEPVRALPAVERRMPDKRKRNLAWIIPIAAVLLIGVLLTTFFLLTIDRPGADPQLTGSNGTYKEPRESDIPATTIHHQTPDDTPVALADTGMNTGDGDISGHENAIPSEDVSISLPPVASVDHSDTPQATADTPQACMIVVGAFSLTANADRMLGVLQALGYQARSVQNGKLAQIGVPADCNAADLDILVQSLRVSIEPSAWVLRPE